MSFYQPSMASIASLGRSQGPNGEYDDEDANTSSEPLVDEQRDEIGEIQEWSKTETLRIKSWRIVVSLILLCIAAGVTVATSLIMRHQQGLVFIEAFKHFADILADAALEQTEDLHDAMTTFGHEVAAVAEASGQEWPFFTMPNFEAHAQDFFAQTDSEMLFLVNRVAHENRSKYEAYVTENYEATIKESHMYLYGNLSRLQEEGYTPFIAEPPQWDALNLRTPFPDAEEYFPYYSFSPPPLRYSLVNTNAMPNPFIESTLTVIDDTLVSVDRTFNNLTVAFPGYEHDRFHSGQPREGDTFPHATMYHGIQEDVANPESRLVAVVIASFAWDAKLRNILPPQVKGITAVLENSCNQVNSYRVDGPDCFYLGSIDAHDSDYNDQGVTIDLAKHLHKHDREIENNCRHVMHLYPSKEFEKVYRDFTPRVFEILLVCGFILIATAFFVYDLFVHQRNTRLVHQAARSNAIVSSMFPDHIREQLMAQGRDKNATKSTKMKNFLSATDIDMNDPMAKPLADLFLNTTVIVADIVGFTAWSSMREPSQVFTLLETVFSGFDHQIKRRRLFKVETVGDCYVAVAGLPDARKDHAAAACRCARLLMNSFRETVKRLELVLGPDTADLQLRMGIHSGPVTAGVLRGDRSRFQLFGDTMNLTAAMERTSRPGWIQVSQQTVDELAKLSRQQWVTLRDNRVDFGTKGNLKTYWLTYSGPNVDFNSSEGGASSRGSHEDFYYGNLKLGYAADDKKTRLIDWNTEALGSLVRQVNTRRAAVAALHVNSNMTNSSIDDASWLEVQTIPLDEMKEVIDLPEFDIKVVEAQKKIKVDIPVKVAQQLREFVSCVADLYCDENPFHNFEHASHVVLSVTKLLSRIVAPTEFEEALAEGRDENSNNAAISKLHDHTYGITSDPLTQFACAFAALIHDIEHSGVPNNQLMQEKPHLAEKYKRHSVAEQNSFDLAWELFMEFRFKDLRRALFAGEEEFKRFRELIVNSLLATDIHDKELKLLRNSRWEKAFKVNSDPTHMTSRKATIVIEHLIQASDVSHTMQHWNIYRKWNERLFEEIYRGYRQGRIDMDPSVYWAKGELAFFDFYIIPLANKLKECGVFGKSSDEFLNYAQQNRREWKSRAKEVVAEMTERFSKNEY